HVGGVELVDRGGQGQAADVRVGQFPVGGPRVVEQRLHAVAVDLPGGDRVLVRRGAAGQVDAGPGGQEGGQPLGQVADHVAGGPSFDRGGRVPGLRSIHTFGKKACYLAVTLSRRLGQ